MTCETAQLELDFSRPARSAQLVDRALAEIGMPAVQRAVLQLLLLRGHKDEDGLTQLRLSLRQAGDWLRTHVDLVPCVAGLSLGHSALRQACQTLREIGLLIITCDHRGVTVIRTHFGRVKRYYAEQSEPVDFPLFEPLPDQRTGWLGSGGQSRAVVGSGGHDRAVVGSGGQGRAVVGSGGHSNEKEEEDNNCSSSSESESGVAVGRDLSTLPALRHLPAAVWDRQRDGSELLQTLDAWQSEHGVDPSDLAAVCGLLRASRGKGNPAGYFLKSSRGIWPHVIADGQAWIDATRSAATAARYNLTCRCGHEFAAARPESGCPSCGRVVQTDRGSCGAVGR